MKKLFLFIIEDIHKNHYVFFVGINSSIEALKRKGEILDVKKQYKLDFDLCYFGLKKLHELEFTHYFTQFKLEVTEDILLEMIDKRIYFYGLLCNGEFKRNKDALRNDFHANQIGRIAGNQGGFKKKKMLAESEKSE